MVRVYAPVAKTLLMLYLYLYVEDIAELCNIGCAMLCIVQAVRHCVRYLSGHSVLGDESIALQCGDQILHVIAFCIKKWSPVITISSFLYHGICGWDLATYRSFARRHVFYWCIWYSWMVMLGLSCNRVYSINHFLGYIVHELGRSRGCNQPWTHLWTYPGS